MTRANLTPRDIIAAYDRFNASLPSVRSRIGIAFGALSTVVSIIMFGAWYVG